MIDQNVEVDHCLSLLHVLPIAVDGLLAIVICTA